MLIRKIKYFSNFLVFFSLYESFPAFICANNTINLFKSLFGVEIFNPIPFLTPFNTIVDGTLYFSSSTSSGNKSFNFSSSPDFYGYHSI